jgi:hypothetical protein
MRRNTKRSDVLSNFFVQPKVFAVRVIKAQVAMDEIAYSGFKS